MRNFSAEGIEEVTAAPIRLQFPVIKPLGPAFRDQGDKRREVVEGAMPVNDESCLLQCFCQSVAMVLGDVLAADHFRGQA
jgi:hypothetical protein